MKYRSFAQIQTTLRNIALAMQAIGDEKVCLLHCMQPKRSAYYEDLKDEFGVQVHLLDRGEGLISRAAFGVAALIRLTDYNKLEELFMRISEQAAAGLYSVSPSTSALLSKAKLSNRSEIIDFVQSDPTHLSFQVDEDSADADGLVATISSAGKQCPRNLVVAAAIDPADIFG